jgi:hypothetical protein
MAAWPPNAGQSVLFGLCAVLAIASAVLVADAAHRLEKFK